MRCMSENSAFFRHLELELDVIVTVAEKVCEFVLLLVL